MEAVRIARRLLLVSALGAAGALVASGSAGAKGCSSGGGGSAAVAQYTEQIPTSCGPHVSGSGDKSTKLPRSIERRVDSQGGSQATILKRIATSQRYGAPQQKIAAP